MQRAGFAPKIRPKKGHKCILKVKKAIFDEVLEGGSAKQGEKRRIVGSMAQVWWCQCLVLVFGSLFRHNKVTPEQREELKSL